ncbi:hypothetical protein PR003_g6998 [Phytophthora rubi]|nr:hypothetical protein PR003_g6998 [Phytophthora rubi]
MGHVNYRTLKRLADSGAVRGLTISPGSSPPKCIICALTKSTTNPTSVERTSSDEAAAGVCHVDLSGPVSRSIDKNRYFMALVWRGYVQTYGLKKKSQAHANVKAFIAMIERHASVSAVNIKVLRTDGGTEFLNKDFRQLGQRSGIIHQHTTTYTSAQNGVAERAIRTVTEMASAMLVDSGLPHDIWEFALEHAAYIRNRIPRQGRDKTPHEELFGRRPDVSNLPIFGQAVVARVPDPIRRKTRRFVDTRGQLGAFAGCTDQVKGFRVYAARAGRAIFFSRDVNVIDRMLFELERLDDNVPDDSADEGEDNDEEQTETPINSELASTRRSQRIARQTLAQAHAFAVLNEILKEPLNLPDEDDSWCSVQAPFLA